MSVVQLFVQEQKVWGQFSEHNEKLKRANLGEMYVFATFRPIIDLLSSTSVAVIVYFGARFLLEGLVSLGVLIAFINLIRRFYQPVMSISEQFTVLQSALAGSERVFEMLDDTDRIPDDGQHAPPGDIGGSLTFENVWFEYKEGEPVIRDLSFSVAPGETVAVVGYTGAGKTTIANLLTRMWDIQKGRILLDGVDIRDYRLDELRTIIQPIQQDVFLFSDTIASNIALGRDVSDEGLREIGALVQAGFVDKLPKQYETTLTEGATNISTGERQLLSFARILAHDPRIIIMDEATASIDTETEQLIQQAVGRLMEGRTSLVIAHRLSTIKNADRIMVLAQGELVEEGTHDSLIAERGIYYNLYKLQYQEASPT
jgi:ATP-binding cassette subfamily B protein